MARFADLTSLGKSEARFRAFVTASADVVYRMNADWSEMSQLEGKTFLRDTGEPNGNWIDRYIHPDDHASAKSAIAEAIRTRSRFELEHRVIRADGSLGFTMSRAVPILNDDGEIEEWLGTASDITEYKAVQCARIAAEAASREAEVRYLTLINAFDQSFCTIELAFDAGGDPRDYRFLEVSPTFEGQTGIKHAVGRWMRDIATDLEQIWLDRYGHVAMTGKSIRFEGFSAALDRWWDVFAFRIDEPAQRKVGVLFRDISDRKRTDAALVASEERFLQFGEASQDILWTRDAATMQWEYLTPAFETIYGIERAAALRGDNMTGWLDLILPEDRDHVSASLQRVREGHRMTFEFRIVRPTDGGIRWLRNTDFPILDGSGQVVRIGGIGHDITELKRTEEALATAEARQRTLMEGIPQLVWRSCGEGRWTWASPQWCAFTGQTQAQTHDMGWLDMLHPDDRAHTVRAWGEARPHGMLDVEYRVRRVADGAWIWHHTRSVPVRGADGRIVEWLGTSTDIQDLRELQARQEVLVTELQHRTFNLMGVIRSMADVTLRSSATLDEFRPKFRDRIDALARVQRLLSRLGTGDHIAFDVLIRSELTAAGAFQQDDGRVTMAGPDGIALRSGTVQAFAMAIHELTTNAVKYGALKQTGAQLDVRWRVERGDDDDPWLHVDWTESGVVMLDADAARVGTGQGRALIEKALPYQLRARTSYVLTDDGVRCSIALPVARQAKGGTPGFDG